MSTAGHEKLCSPDHSDAGSWDSPHLQHCQSLRREQELAEDLTPGLNPEAWNDFYLHLISQDWSCGPTQPEWEQEVQSYHVPKRSALNICTFGSSTDDYNRAPV